MSTSRKSKEAAPHRGKRRQSSETLDFTELQNLAKSVRQNIDQTFRLSSKGANSNIPQIFTSNLFAVEPSVKSDATDQFMNLESIVNKRKSSASQIGEVKNLLATIGSKKEGLNFEAGSYMATLEYTMRSISGMKQML